jgi:CTP:molybdopterin cytidylyltransferase MocA
VRVAGLLLAAGEGRRYGRPKALVQGSDGEAWVRTRARVLESGGCSPVLVVVGAAAAQVLALLPPTAVPVIAHDWAEGMGASLREGLAAVETLEPQPDAVLVGLVDTPGLTAPAVARLMTLADADVLAQAAYEGRRGHPVLLGRAHWAGVAAVARGDRGARDYLRSRTVRTVECGDVADGRDVDTLPTG